ncbi:MAG: hypothetical protein JWO03_3933 [Bacteroidetes bacterium]|nr:hypothetical protein [Bacteroidota bacterium]
MYKTSILLFLNCLIAAACMAQKPYAMLCDLKPVATGRDMDVVSSAGCLDCDAVLHGPDTATATRLKRNKEWMSAYDALKAKGWHYDSAKAYHIASDSFLRAIRSTHYSILLNRPYASLGLGKDQNSSSPECQFSSEDGVIGTVRFRVVCSDCPYSKRKTLYYIFAYGKSGIVVRHGLAELKSSHKPKK